MFIIGPDKKIRLMVICPMSVGRHFAESRRSLDAVRATGGVISIKRSVSKRPANPTPRVWLARNGAVLVTVVVVVLVASHDASRCR